MNDDSATLASIELGPFLWSQPWPRSLTFSIQTENESEVSFFQKDLYEAFKADPEASLHVSELVADLTHHPTVNRRNGTSAVSICVKPKRKLIFFLWHEIMRGSFVELSICNNPRSYNNVDCTKRRQVPEASPAKSRNLHSHRAGPRRFLDLALKYRYLYHTEGLKIKMGGQINWKNEEGA